MMTEEQKEKNRVRASAWYYANKERKKEYDRAYQIENKDKLRKQKREWKLTNKDKIREYGKKQHQSVNFKKKKKEWALANKDKLKEQMRLWNVDNKDYVREQKHLYYVDNKDVIKAKKRSWKKANTAKVNNSNRNRRALKHSASGTCSVEQAAARINLYGGMCAYCCVVPYEHLDHVIPLSRGGSNWPANLRPACARCNLSKNNKLLAEWRTSKAA